MQVDVVVVQPRDDGAVRGVQHVLPHDGRQSLGHFEDAMVGPDVHDRPVQPDGALN
jgi:hypothetical protein